MWTACGTTMAALAPVELELLSVVHCTHLQAPHPKQWSQIRTCLHIKQWTHPFFPSHLYPHHHVVPSTQYRHYSYSFFATQIDIPSSSFSFFLFSKMYLIKVWLIIQIVLTYKLMYDIDLILLFYSIKILNFIFILMKFLFSVIYNSFTRVHDH